MTKPREKNARNCKPRLRTGRRKSGSLKIGKRCCGKSYLVEQMNERKKRKPAVLTTPVHKVITPVLISRDTTCIVNHV